MKAAVYDQEHRVHTEWQLPLHGGKISPVSCKGVHAHPPFTLPSQSCGVRSMQLRGQISSPYFYSTPICTF
jgi:hypothetical protein